MSEARGEHVIPPRPQVVEHPQLDPGLLVTRQQITDRFGRTEGRHRTLRNERVRCLAWYRRALWEVAHAAWLNAQLHDDDIAELHGLPGAKERARQARHLAEGYGLSRAQRASTVERMIELAVYSAQAEAVQYGVSAASPEGSQAGEFPVLWAVSWRVRSAAWMLRNREMLSQVMA